ncbi:MAG TPA: hypothetical protein VLG47_06530 [Candidatus Saccharimonadales bacterium]|nr:hypothetical protein [Candidatus Saccharimonadales bacterium]
MKKGIFGLALVVAILGSVAFFSRPAKAFSFFGIKIDISSSQTTTTTENGKSHTTHSSTSYHYDSSKDDPSDNPCAHFKNHEYEVCTAYVANSVLADLVPYYTFVHSDVDFMKQAATDRLDSRYSGQAYSVLTNRTRNWPIGETEVDVPKIKILSVKSNLSSNTATMKTRESWTVKTDSDQILYRENSKIHTITMHRVPSYVLHKWVVTNIQ